MKKILQGRSSKEFRADRKNEVVFLRLPTKDNITKNGLQRERFGLHYCRLISLLFEFINLTTSWAT